ncbi:hypothetical protein EJ110_NYTH01655 [Nymphaea thermarum]|nr:hypothetical protein EJ110_NYTH01655 [Nymphaea thermarum]
MALEAADGDPRSVFSSFLFGFLFHPLWAIDEKMTMKMKEDDISDASDLEFFQTRKTGLRRLRWTAHCVHSNLARPLASIFPWAD